MKWNSIETFFLDLDGTLLDLAFDNFFWHEHLPYVYANSKDIEFKKAREDFEKMYKNKENSIQWYSLSYWSKTLEIDLCSELLKVKNKIRTLNNSEKFLQILKEEDVSFKKSVEILNKKFSISKKIIYSEALKMWDKN